MLISGGHSSILPNQETTLAGTTTQKRTPTTLQHTHSTTQQRTSTHDGYRGTTLRNHAGKLSPQALGCPLSGRTTSPGQLNNWLGHQVYAPDDTAALTPDKQTIMTAYSSAWSGLNNTLPRRYRDYAALTPDKQTIMTAIPQRMVRDEQHSARN